MSTVYPDGLDSGIRPYVELLRENGVETFESCEGGAGHAFAEPTIRFHGGAYDGLRAVGLAIERGLPVRALQRVWDIIDRELTGPHWEVVFWRNANDHSDAPRRTATTHHAPERQAQEPTRGEGE